MINIIYKFILVLISPVAFIVLLGLMSGDNRPTGEFVIYFLLPVIFIFKAFIKQKKPESF